MAHFAELDADNRVIRVIVVSNNDILKNGVEDEATGIEFCKRLLGEDTRWIQTSYNNSFRKRYAGEGYAYNEEYDAFIPPKPFPSWTLNIGTLVYDAPIPRPTDQPYAWDEDTLSWEPIG